MNSFTVAFLFLVVALATATDVDTKSMKTRFLGDVPTSGTLNVPVVKNKGSGNPSPDVTSLLRSITPKSTGDEKKKEEKVHSRTIGNIPKGLWGGASRDGSSIVDSPGDSAGSDSTGESCSAKVSLSFDGDSYSNSDNGMILFDSATYDSDPLVEIVFGLSVLVTFPMEANTIWMIASKRMFATCLCSSVSEKL
jgi:hypothetical protein